MGTRGAFGNQTTPDKSEICHVEDVIDNDESIYTCDIWIYTTHIESSKNANKEDTNGNFFQNLRKEICSALEEIREHVPGSHHWAVVCHLKGSNRKITYEASPVDGKLTAYQTQAVPKKAVGKYRIGEVEISPKSLLEIAQNNCCNGKDYDLLSMNCQSWVTEFLRAIDLHNEIKIWDGEKIAAVFGTIAATCTGLTIASSAFVFGKKKE